MKIIPTIDLERKSAACTLSDMELFVFPELLYSLLLANLMSPRIWAWREDPWFAGIEKMRPYRRILRLKQYIMDHYVFNLDLETWGLTTQARELKRFERFVDAAALAQSNALFGYAGDKFYFDIGIRTHFGLDKYDADTIPYWKTETVEAMDAFRHKPNYTTGAGECVSLSALYAAALFIVAHIPLKDIFMMATPLHSQNFIDVEDGILTNNRRLVTRKMWFNGTALSAQARRALDHERVTIVAHETGLAHVLYPKASIEPVAYHRWVDRLKSFLRAELTDELLGNFIRHEREVQPCFYVRGLIRGVDHFISVERVFFYEQDSKYRLTDDTRPQLMAEIDVEEFQRERKPGCIVLNDLEEYIRVQRVDLNVPGDVARLRQKFECGCLNVSQAIERLIRFCHIEPRIPDLAAKIPDPDPEPLALDITMGREAIFERLSAIRSRNRTADLAFYAWRDLGRTEPEPFLLAALSRSTVSLQGSKDRSDADVMALIESWPAESIYDGPGRLAQPDEVWNYSRGDGVEKVLLMANVLQHRHPDWNLTVTITEETVALAAGALSLTLPTAKGLKPQVWPVSDYAVNDSRNANQ